MAYEAHITRAEFWVHDDFPITFEEIKALDLPDGFSAEKNCVATTKTPFGEMSADLGKCIVFELAFIKFRVTTAKSTSDNRGGIYADDNSFARFPKNGKPRP